MVPDTKTAFGLTSWLLARPAAYRLWQAPFAGQKLRPLYRHNDLSRARRVLDVACGPGTNAAHFAHAEYLGLDLEPAYVDYARRHRPGRFIVADASDFVVPPGESFDFILVNSFLHHVDDARCRRILARLGELLSEDGHVHVLDLVLPRRPGVARFLARLDRGPFARPAERWRELFAETFVEVASETFRLGVAGIGLWNMVYLKGRARR